MDKTGIANLALSNLGEASIQSLSDNNARARACSSRIEDVIVSVLRMHVWNSALERALLTNIGEPIFGWNYIYQLPADYIRVVEVTATATEAITLTSEVIVTGTGDAVALAPFM